MNICLFSYCGINFQHLFLFFNQRFILQRMNKIVDKRLRLNIPIQQNQQHNQINRLSSPPHSNLIQNILIINKYQIALVKTNSIILCNQITKQIIYTISLPLQYEAFAQNIVFSFDQNKFYCDTTSPKFILSITNEKQPKIMEIYDFLKNNKNKQEWSPKMFMLQQSQKLILRRTYYAQFNVLVIDTKNDNKIVWNLNMCAQCLNPLDNNQYLVDYLQNNIKHSIIINIFDVQQLQKYSYTINDQFQPSICKGIKYIASFLGGIRVLMLVNTKFQGFRAYSIDLFQDNGHYLINFIQQFKNQIQKLITCDADSFYTLEYNIIQEDQLELCFATYHLDNQNKTINAIDALKIDSYFEGYNWNFQQKIFLIFQNTYQKGENNIIDSQKQMIVGLTFFRIASKKEIYNNIIKQLMQKNYVQNQNFGLQIIQML